MEGIQVFLWIAAITPLFCGAIGWLLFQRSRYLAVALISTAVGFVIIDIGLVTFFSGILV